jgi:hypothetical protein
MDWPGDAEREGADMLARLDALADPGAGQGRGAAGPGECREHMQVRWAGAPMPHISFEIA